MDDVFQEPFKKSDWKVMAIDRRPAKADSTDSEAESDLEDVEVGDEVDEATMEFTDEDGWIKRAPMKKA